MNEIHLKWLTKAYELTHTEELYMECVSLKERRKVAIALLNLHMERQKNDPLGVPAITITGIYRDGKQWICFKRAMASPLTAYIKDITTEKVTVVSLEQREERRRRLILMRDDGITLEQAQKMEDIPLTEEEEELWNLELNQ